MTESQDRRPRQLWGLRNLLNVSLMLRLVVPFFTLSIVSDDLFLF